MHFAIAMLITKLERPSTPYIEGEPTLPSIRGQCLLALQFLLHCSLIE
jgi:hypothetical protein